MADRHTTNFRPNKQTNKQTKTFRTVTGHKATKSLGKHVHSNCSRTPKYIGLLVSLFFGFAYLQHNPKEFFLDGLKKLEQRSHKCVELRGEYVE
jgi:hypothetical protein